MTPPLNLKQFKADFFRRFPDPSFFDCAEFNLLKVILDGLKVDYASRGPVPKQLFGSGLMMFVKNMINRRDHRKKLKKYSNELLLLAKRPYFFIDHSGRVVQNASGSNESYYLGGIKRHLGAGNIVHLVEKWSCPEHPYDLCVGAVRALIASEPADADDRQLQKDLLLFFSRLQHSGLLSTHELMNITAALQKFYEEYRQWKFILTFLPHEKIYLLCHYHKEGAILAMRRAKRFIIELQHGLISRNDLFYYFPAAVKAVRPRALFPDRLLVFGKLWKDKLAGCGEFAEQQLYVVGDFVNQPLSGARGSLVSTGDKKIILVATQTFLHTYFIEYINNLSRSLLQHRVNAEIWVKIHPAEKDELYTQLTHLLNVRIVRQAIGQLLPSVDHQVSVYSTTLYEGIKYGTPGYSLDVPECRPYTRELVEDGISIVVPMDFNPLLTSASPMNLQPDPKDLFSDFDLSVLVEV